MRRISTALAAIAFLAAGEVAAQVFVPPVSAPDAASAAVDPRFEMLRDILAAKGPDAQIFGPTGLGSHRGDGVAGMLRFRRTLTASEVASLRSGGVEFLRADDGRLVEIGSVYGAFVTWRSLAALRAHPELEWAECAWQPVVLQPLEVTTQIVGAASHLKMPIVGNDGAGQVIGDIDNGVDVLHPHFFFADGGAFPWIDVDEDGAFTPRVDAVDYNGNGEADGNEKLHVLDGAYAQRGADPQNDDGVLDVQFDWLYADRNRDAERNAGAAEGFTERDPGYGEPVFVVDDVDGDGKLGFRERLLLLGSSKVQRFVTSERTYVRGDDLIEAAEWSDLQGAFHGTGVASILLGGQPRAHLRHGVAPGAELVMYSSYVASREAFDDTAQLRAIEDAEADGLTALVHEWTNPFSVQHDGSGNLEAAMDAASAAGVVQVNPVGNLNLSQKHIEVATRAGEPAVLEFVVGDGFAVGTRTLPYGVVYASLFWRGDHLPEIELRNPAGEALAIPMAAQHSATIGDGNFYSTYSKSSRGTHHLFFTVWTDDQTQSLLAGDWSVTATTSVADQIWGRVSDFHSGWASGIFWRDATADRSTVVYPATADSALGVAAFAGRHTGLLGSEPGELRNYSGRGPRIDGAQAVDIAAPDDPYAALVAAPEWVAAGYGRSWFWTFGGTSGAAPHVAGTVALYRALHPESSADEVRDAILGAAVVDDEVAAIGVVPNTAWGHGKLDAFAALQGRAVPEANAPPSISGVVGSAEALAVEATDPDGDELRVRWDFEYDGTWDTEWLGVTDTVSVDPDTLLRIEVVDGQGEAAGWLGRVEPPASMEPSPDAGGSDAGDVGEERDHGFEVERVRPDCIGCSSARSDGAIGLVLALMTMIGARRRRR